MSFRKRCCFLLGWLAFVALAASARADAPRWPFIQLTLACAANHPVDLQNAADGSGRLFIVQQDGQILILKNGALNSAPFLDLRSRVRLQNEQGLLGLAFPPSYGSKQCFYVYYSRASDGASVVSRFRLTSADLADPASEEVLLVQPQTYDNHKGGQLAFGPDGFLYIALGDGGSEGDPAGNGQSLTTLLGKLLRIQVENTPAGVPYLIPPDNPFANDLTNAREILFWGLRNPWRFCFDRSSGDLFIGDVGQNTREEIDYIPAAKVAQGGNFGWSLKEGSFDYKNPGGISTGLIAPVYDYGRSLGSCVIGGRVYRGADPRLQGFYFFADEALGAIFAMELQSGTFQTAFLKTAYLPLVAFGEDESGELYLAANSSEQNGVYRLSSLNTMPPPAISPNAGVYTNGVTVTVTPPLPGISIHYTLDGSAPTPTSPELPAGQTLNLTDPATVTAIAYRDDLPPSVPVSAKYQMYVDSVRYLPPSTTFHTAVDVQMSVTTPSAEIHYTIDGTGPAMTSALYQGQPIHIDHTTTLKAKAFRSGWISNGSTYGYYRITAAAPTLLSPWVNLYEPVQLVSSTPGAIIHYTLDGSAPTINSPVWTGPLDLPPGTVIKAIAAKDQYEVEYPTTSTVVRQLAEPCIVSTVVSAFANDFIPVDGQTFYTISGRYLSKFANGTWTTLYTRAGAYDLTSLTLTPGNQLAVVMRDTDLLLKFVPPQFSSPTTWATYPVPGTSVVALGDDDFLLAAPSLNQIYRLTGSYQTAAVAGTGQAGSTDGAALQATFNYPVGIATGPDGSIYVAERNGAKVRRLGTDNVVSAIAGSGTLGWNDGPSPQACFSGAVSVAADRLGNVYVAESQPGRIRKIRPDGTVSTFRGPYYSSTGTVIASENAGYIQPTALRVGADGVLYFIDQYRGGICKVVPADSDGDGLSDSTEPTLGAPFAVDVDDSQADFDGDGYSNLAEWISETDPSDPLSLPRAQATRKLDDSTLLVSLPSTPGLTYQIEYSDDISTWKPMGLPIQAKLRSITTADHFSPVVPNRFYRLRQLP